MWSKPMSPTCIVPLLPAWQEILMRLNAVMKEQPATPLPALQLTFSSLPPQQSVPDRHAYLVALTRTRAVMPDRPAVMAMFARLTNCTPRICFAWGRHVTMMMSELVVVPAAQASPPARQQRHLLASPVMHSVRQVSVMPTTLIAVAK